jgi:D-glycero-D-manno-heptose 1,7-bisphosphate phosphatase
MFLFLDRDGVINARTPGDYVRTPEAFQLLPQVPEAIAVLKNYFQRIFVVTNQAGIGKGLMTYADIDAVHATMQSMIPTVFDGIYYCPHRPEQNCNCRKPKPGMAWKAHFAYAHVKYDQSWMVGDSASDIIFGQSLGMKTVRVGTKPEDEAQFLTVKPDYQFDHLPAFADWCTHNLNK